MTGISRHYSARAQATLAESFRATYRDRSAVKYAMGTGLPDSGLFPIDELQEYSARALATHGVECLSYGMGGQGGFAGPLALREQLAKRTLARDGRDVGPDGIVLTSGASHGAALVANAYLSPGDVALAEAQSWPWALRYMREAGATVVAVPMDDDGMVVGRLERQIIALKDEGKHPKLIYTIPTFHVPTATCLPEGRRRMLIDVAQRHDMVVFEDNLYYDLRYFGDPVSTLLSMDDAGVVVQNNGFSKTLAPGLRMGWVTGSTEAMLAVEMVRQDLGVNQWTAHMLALWMADGRYDRHLEVVRESARRKHGIVLKTLREHCQPYVRFNVPDGGIYFCLELAPHVDLDLFREQLDAEGVDIAPGERFALDDERYRRYIRIAYLDVADDDLELFIAMLGKCLRASASMPNGALTPTNTEEQDDH